MGVASPGMQRAKPFVVVAALAAAVTASLRERRAQADVDRLWHEATADSPR